MFDLLPHLNPAFVIILAGLLCIFSPSHFVRKALMIAAPVLAAVMIFQTYDPVNTLRGQFTFAGIDFTTVRADTAGKRIHFNQVSLRKSCGICVFQIAVTAGSVMTLR